MSESRKNILNKIRMALVQPTPLPFPESEGNTTSPFQPLNGDIVVEFAEQFTALQGKFIFCANEAEAKYNFAQLCYRNGWTKVYCGEEKWTPLLLPHTQHPDILSSDAAVTGCELLVARTGSLLLSSTYQGRVPSVYAPVHICVARSSQIVYTLKEGLGLLRKKYGQFMPSLLTLASGPSRTADIEKTLVVGVHGPKEVYCLLIDDAS